MGMYTMLEGQFRLADDTSAIVLDAIDWMAGSVELPSNIFENLHPLFKTKRCGYMLHGRSAYLDDLHMNKCKWSREDKELTVGCDIRNYDGEIELFLSFIAPHLVWARKVLTMYEEFDVPTLYRLDGGRLVELRHVEDEA
jgi:hypothetical protein